MKLYFKLDSIWKRIRPIQSMVQGKPRKCGKTFMKNQISQDQSCFGQSASFNTICKRICKYSNICKGMLFWSLIQWSMNTWSWKCLREEVNRFLNERRWNLLKVALIIDVYGACRREGLHFFDVCDIDDDFLIIRHLSFLYQDQSQENIFCNYRGEGCRLYRKYDRPRPGNIPHNCFSCAIEDPSYTPGIGGSLLSSLPMLVLNWIPKTSRWVMIYIENTAEKKRCGVWI